MKILIDMNLSPVWVDFLGSSQIKAVHWSTIGSPDADDRTIFKWAGDNGHIIFTHDLDFSAILALTGAGGPSVVQVRSHNIMPSAIGEIVVRELKLRADNLIRGAVVVIDDRRSRVRILPF